MKRSLLLASLTLAFSSFANATITVALQSVSVGPAPYVWTYDVDLAANSLLDSDNTSFFTLYDIGGYILGSATAPSDWTITEQAVGSTPIGVNPVVIFDSSIVNLTFTYTGATILTGPVGAADLGTFTLLSTTDISRNANYTYRSQDSDGSVAEGFSSEPVPGAAQGNVPEPATMGLMGSALAGLAFFARRRA